MAAEPPPDLVARYAVPDCDDVLYMPDCFGTAVDISLALAAAIAWREESIVLFGRRVTVPRLCAWYGDVGVAYRYSHSTHRANGWLSELEVVRDQLHARLGIRFNFVLGKSLRSGQDAMGWHADDEPELGARPCIASLSFGALKTISSTGSSPRATCGADARARFTAADVGTFATRLATRAAENARGERAADQPYISMRGDAFIVLRAEVQLERFNTLRLPSIAQYFASPERVEDVHDVLLDATAKGLPVTILGGGSNVVLRSRVPGCVIMPRLLGIGLRRVDDAFLVTAGAGVLWHDLVRFCLGQGIGGVENLTLIPGCVGAAPIQNIGAYGLELKERFHSLTALSCRDGSTVVMDAHQCEFGYRDSVFKHAAKDLLLITSVTLQLRATDEVRAGYPDVRREIAAMGIQPTPIGVAEAVTRVRRRKLPDVRRVPNAGSFFKNPVLEGAAVERLRSQLGNIQTYDDANGIKIPAARLIDAAGWKGKQLGPAAVWHRQPLVLINRGGARGADILRLAHAIQSDIAGRYGIELEIEPTVVGTEM